MARCELKRPASSCETNRSGTHAGRQGHKPTPAITADRPPDLGLHMRAGDGNRTRTTSLEVSATVRGLPAQSVICEDHDGLSVSDCDYLRVLLPSGTQRARPGPARCLLRLWWLARPSRWLWCDWGRRRPGQFSLRADALATSQSLRLGHG
jgi:hypothetical protein